MLKTAREVWVASSTAACMSDCGFSARHFANRTSPRDGVLSQQAARGVELKTHIAHDYTGNDLATRAGLEGKP